MAQVVRLTCGKCGNSVTLVAKDKITRQVGAEMDISCSQAQKVYPSMSGCDDSPLKLTRINEERALKPSDRLLEDFSKRLKEAEAAPKPEEAPDPAPAKEDGPVDPDTPTETDVEDDVEDGMEAKESDV